MCASLETAFRLNPILWPQAHPLPQQQLTQVRTREVSPSWDKAVAPETAKTDAASLCIGLLTKHHSAEYWGKKKNHKVLAVANIVAKQTVDTQTRVVLMQIFECPDP